MNYLSYGSLRIIRCISAVYVHVGPLALAGYMYV